MSARAVIFDCDGVLINSEVIYIDVERALLREIGLDLGVAEYQARFVGLSHADLVAEIRAMCRAAGLTFPEDFDARHTAACTARFADELAPIDGAMALLEAHAGPRAVASSSTPEALSQKLVQTGLADYFSPHIYSTAEVDRGKPAPDVFLYAADRIRVAAKDCIVIEDSVNGVRAGKAAGMTVWGFTGGGHADQGLSDRLGQAGADLVLECYENIASRLFAATHR